MRIMKLLLILTALFLFSCNIETAYRFLTRTKKIETHYPDGALKSIRYYKDDKPHGLHTEYNADGSIRYRANYQNGQRNGLYTWYRIDGTIYYTANYQNGQLHGLYTGYNTDGTIDYLYCYQNGRKRKYTYSDFNSFTCP